MKKFVLLFVVLHLISCNTEYKKKYIIETLVLDFDTSVNSIKIDTLEYLNDTLAIRGAYQKLFVSQALDEYSNKKGLKNYSKEISFDLYNDAKKKIKLDLSKKELDSLKKRVFNSVRNSMENASHKSNVEVTDVEIDKQFSSWNGAHIKLQELIKQNMNDPDSYEHIETKYKNMGDVLSVVTKYRGNNSFGAKVIQVTAAKCDLKTGDVLTIE